LFKNKNQILLDLVLPDIFDEFFTEVIKGVEQHCFSEGYYTMVTSSHSKKTTVEAIVDFMSTGLVGGIIMMAPAIGDNIKDLIRKSTVPFVIINGKKKI
jgi:LacI family transcriptional regulator